MTAGRILGMRLLRALAVRARDRSLVGRERAAVDRGEPERLHMRHVEPAALMVNIADRVCAYVAELRSVGQVPDARAVQYDQSDPFFHTAIPLFRF